MNKRDNFSKKVIQTLKLRVASRCSNPSCRVPTSGPSTDIEKVNNIGVAAHICAAAVNGPRYNYEMSSSQRKLINNAIWLCSNCSIKIDRDPKDYPVELLNEWKNTAELKAKNELGEILPDRDHTIDNLAEALLGFPKNILSESVENVCKASERALESLDPRFNVTASRVNNVTEFSIHAKEPVSAIIEIKSSYINEFKDKYLNFVNHGEELEIDSDAIRMTGSKIFDYAFNTDRGKFKLIGQKRKVKLKLSLVDPITNIVQSLDDCDAFMVIGKKTLRISGSIFSKLLELELKGDIGENDKLPLNFNFTINLASWEKRDVLELPYFNRICEFTDKIVGGWLLNLTVDMDGEVVISSKGDLRQDRSIFKPVKTILDYIGSVRDITRFMGSKLLYRNDFEYSSETHNKLFQISENINGNSERDAVAINSNASCTIIVIEETIKMLTDQREYFPDMIFIERSPETITVFSQELILPLEKHRLTKIKPKITVDIDKVKLGDELYIEWVPVPGSKYIMEAERP